MSIQQAYDNWSSSYDSDENLTRDLDRQVTRETLADQQFASTLEIGCGTGKNTAFLAERSAHVHALDFSEGMIEKAREKVKMKNVRFSMADLTQRWPAEDGTCDLVVCNLVLEHIEDLSFMFLEAFRVLKEGGKFLVNELHPFLQYEGKKARFERDSGVTEIPAFTHHISEFLSEAANHGLRLTAFDERWHDQDPRSRPPRLVSFVFQKG